jgi:serine protease Do
MRLTNYLVVLLLLFAGFGRAQESEKPAENKQSDALHDLSAALESLSRRAGRAVVQVFSTGFVLNDDDDAGDAALLTRQKSTGSGVIFSADGYVVTNAHVVKGGRQIEVQLAESYERSPGHEVTRPSGARLEAKIVGMDRESDLAVLKVERKDLPFLRFGDSAELHQGQLVLAFGNPLGLSNSVTMGVVSSTARQIKPDDPMLYIQTDAPINPGNSGGPLLDADGRVVGINTFILSQSGGSEGIGFAIPSNVVHSVVDQLRKEGHVHRGEIGVYAQTITPSLAAGLQLSRDWGVVLADVEPDSPAEKAGLKPGDVVLSVNGREMENARQLEVDLYRRAVGEKVTIEVQRGTEKLRFSVPIIEREDDPQRFADMVNPEKNIVAKLGILCIDINQKVGQMLPDLRKPYGVVVAARAAGSPFSSQLNPGDVIHAVNSEPISSVSALRQALDKRKPTDPIVLQIERDSRLMYLDLELE